MKRNDNSFYALAWLGFIVATGGFIIGLLNLQGDLQTKGFFAVCFFFAIYAAFTVAKVTRDRQEDQNQ
jgi:uncharacterized membrane protein YiaA